MRLSDLGALGAVRVLRDAAQCIQESGVSSLLPRNPYSGELSIEGALAIACGANIKALDNWDGCLEYAPIKGSIYGLFMELIVYLESFIDCDIDQWDKKDDNRQCIDLLIKAAETIEISVL